MKYAKAIVALAVAILAALVTALGTGNTDFSDLDAKTWLIAGGAVLGSGAMTWFVQNVPGLAGGIIKAVVGGLAAAVASLTVALDDNLINRSEQLTALSAFILGLGLVYQVANKE